MKKKKKITLIFSQAKETKKVLFKKHKYYFITSFTCFLKLDKQKTKTIKKFMNRQKYVEIFYQAVLTLDLL